MRGYVFALIGFGVCVAAGCQGRVPTARVAQAELPVSQQSLPKEILAQQRLHRRASAKVVAHTVWWRQM